MPLQATLNATIKAVQTLAADLGDGEFRVSRAGVPIELLNGTGDNQADRLWSDKRTLAASANEDIDLAGALLDGLGQAAVFAKVKTIYVKADAANVNNVVIGNAAANGFVGPFGAATHTLALPPGGVAMLIAPKAGWTVTAATADLLRITNSGAGTAITYDIVVIGTSV